MAISSRDTASEARLSDRAEGALSEQDHLALLDEVDRGMDDVDAGRTISVEEFRAKHA